GSELNRLCQNEYLRTMTGCAPATSFSSARNVRPVTAEIPQDSEVICRDNLALNGLRFRKRARPRAGLSWQHGKNLDRPVRGDQSRQGMIVVAIVSVLRVGEGVLNVTR